VKTGGAQPYLGIALHQTHHMFQMLVLHLREGLSNPKTSTAHSMVHKTPKKNAEQYFQDGIDDVCPIFFEISNYSIYVNSS
jgi:hypothetical protein